jgi:hypothetical protein
VHVGGARVAEVVEVDVGEVELDADRQSGILGVLERLLE